MVALVRFPDWPQRLAAALESRAHTPFAWGRNDCAIFAADMVQAVTGQDFAAAFRGKYRSKKASAAMLKAHGWKDLEALADDMLGRGSENLRRGDVVLYAGRVGNFLGIYWAGQIYGPGPDGVAFWPADRDAILAIWSVG